MKLPFNPSNYKGVVPDLTPQWYQFSGWSAADLRAATQETHLWDEYVNIVDDQGQTGTCEARSACGVLEVLIRKFVSKGVFAPSCQLNAAYWHKRAFELTYPGQPYSDQKGLPLGATFRAFRQDGVIPANASLDAIPASVLHLGAALQIAPVQVGLCVHAGWGPDQVSPQTGEVPWGSFTGTNGHGVFVAGMNVGRDNRPLFTFPNSWGTSWAWYGVGQMEWSQFQATLLSSMLLLYFDYKWLATNRKWERYII